MHEKTCERRYTGESMQEDDMCETVRLAVCLAMCLAMCFAVCLAAYFAVRLAACFAGRYDLGNTDHVRDGAANKQE